MQNQIKLLGLTAIIVGSSLVAACTSTSGRSRPTADGPNCSAGQVMVCDGGTGSSVSDMARRDPNFCSCRSAGQIDQ